MNRMFRAELLKLSRRRVALGVAFGAVAFALVATLTVFLSATGASGRPAERGTTLAELGRAGGATEAFSVGASFTGILVLVVVIANVAGEFSQGTFRTLLLREPRRIGLLAGKLGALLAFAAVVLLVVELTTVLASLAIAPAQDVSSGSWFGFDGLGHAAADYGTALLGLTAWATLGLALAVLVRSIPVALAIGIVWSGPLEHLLADAWTSADRWFPGLLLEAVAAGGTESASFDRAVALVAVYVTVAATVAAWVFARRDVTT